MRWCIALVVGFLVLFPMIYTIIEPKDTTTAIAKTINVDSSDLAEFNTIQDAINTANSGDTIFVNPGIYLENIVIDKPINLIGYDKSNTTIDGKGNITLIISNDTVTIQGFTVTNCSHGIMLNTTSDTTINDNIFINAKYGIYADDKSMNNTIYNNNFKDNIFNAYDASFNSWSFSSSGNYWDDYIGSDENNDGIGDSIYNISGGMSVDAYPLIKPLSLDPVATFSFDPPYPSTDDTMVFTDNSSDDEGISSWSWDFGDGNGSAIQNPEHSYADNGLYNVTLTVSDIFGLTDSYTRVIPVRNVPPTCNFVFSPSQPTDIQTVFFQDDSTDNDGSIINWTWDFGENNTYYTDNVTFQFPDNGTYHVLLIVTDDDGATSSHTVYIHVLNAIPTPSFTYNSMNGTYLEGDQIKFSDHSFDQDGTVVSWSWDLGDGTTSTERQPVHTYQKQGTYTVTLSVVDNDGGIGTSAKSIKIVTTVEGQDWNMGINILDYAFIIFIVVMVTVVFFLSRKYMKI
jgi:parallel beta-helix repeat protein